jgi:hypothetical protein
MRPHATIERVQRGFGFRGVIQVTANHPMVVSETVTSMMYAKSRG